MSSWVLTMRCMRASSVTKPIRSWALLLLPASSLFLIGLLLHPLDPADALALLQSDAIDFLLKAGLAARLPLLLAAGLLILAGIALILAFFLRRRTCLRYHSGLPTSNKLSRLLFQ